MWRLAKFILPEQRRLEMKGMKDRLDASMTFMQ
jgi:hypothetical protein